MRTSAIIFLLFLFGNTFGQITDTDIVNSLLGKKFYEINPQLDSLGVWYHTHFPEKIKENIKVYSIADGDGTVKLFKIKIQLNIIYEIVINYRHDSREQIEDAEKIKNASSFHVGTYSTDMVFKLE